MVSVSQSHEDLLARAATHANKAVVQWFEAASKVHDKQRVAQMLAESPELHGTALHHAARHGHDLVAAQLLTENPKLANATDEYGFSALHVAAERGHDKVVAVLLAMSPSSINALIWTGRTALHSAAGAGHDKVVAQLLTASPKLAKVADSLGWTALHCAACNGHCLVAEMLLASTPELVHRVTDRGRTVLHLASECGRSKQFITKLLALNPSALRAVNSDSNTPFCIAVAHGNDCAIELLQMRLTLDEIADTFVACKKSYEERLRPVMEEQCACLAESLSQDVVGEVFEYLGFDSTKRPQKRNKLA